MNASMLNLSLLDSKEGENNGIDDGFDSMLKAMDIWSNLISKKCKTKCKHLTKDGDDRQCNVCHRCFRDSFATIQHLQIMADFMYLHGFVAKEIFVYDRMIRLLSTMSAHLDWCREYRLLCLCWSAFAYLKFGNSNQSKKIFDELSPILLPKVPDISVHILNHIKMIYANYQILTNDKNGMQSLLYLKREFDKNRIKISTSAS